MYTKTKKLFKEIEQIKIQGATNIALAVADHFQWLAKNSIAKSTAKFIKEIKEVGQYLLSARETEPMAENVVEYIVFYLQKNKKSDLIQIKKITNDAICYLKIILKQNNQSIIKHGVKLIKNNNKIFTHCHSGTVINILKLAKKNKKKFEVFQTETRPLFQGHRTANDLAKAKIKDTLIIDSAASYVISAITGKKMDIDKVIIGCDAISRDGSCVNKVGSFGLALTAYINKIPVYIATQALKINEDAKNLKFVNIEMRQATEVWAKAPKGVKIFNPAFDQVPAEFITAYITEFGLIKPKDLMKKIEKFYPWLK